MDLLMDLLLLLAAVTLVIRSSTERDEVWCLCLRALAVVALVAVITNPRGMPISLMLLALALYLPGARQFEKLPPSSGS